MLLYMLSQWREIARSFCGREARFGTLAVVQRGDRARHPGRAQLPGVASQQALGLTAAKQFTLSDQTRKVLEGLQKPVNIRVFAELERLRRGSAIGSTSTST